MTHRCDGVNDKPCPARDHADFTMASGQHLCWRCRSVIDPAYARQLLLADMRGD